MVISRRTARISFHLALLSGFVLFLTSCGMVGRSNTARPGLELTLAALQDQNGVPVTGPTPTGRTPSAVTPSPGGQLANPQGSNSESVLQSLNQTATALSRTAAGENQEQPVEQTPAPVQIGTALPTASAAITPLVKVSDQAVKDGVVTVDEVVSGGPGWVAVYTVENGQPSQLLGYSPVRKGDNKNVVFQIDSSRETSALMAILHIDAGKAGIFEFPGPDAAVIEGLHFVSAQFADTSKASASMGVDNRPLPLVPTFTPAPMQPSVTVMDQPIHQGMILIPLAYSVGDSWLVIHPQYADGSMGNFIGYALLHDGKNYNIRINVNTTRTKPTLIAMLHVNKSGANVPQFPGIDAPLMLNGEMVAPTFKIQGPLTGDVVLTLVMGKAGLRHLADSYGYSLYYNVNDPPGQSACSGGCLGSFRPLLAAGSFRAEQGVAPDQISTAPMPGGSRQVTYGGMPLYYNLDDHNPGETNGQGLNGNWFVVIP